MRTANCPRLHTVNAVATVVLLALGAVDRALGQTPAPEVELREIVIEFAAADGTTLEAKLTLPAAATAPPPVVFLLHGAGVASYDTPYRYVDDEGRPQRGRYLDFHARELARRGIALFRMSKRGCRTDPATGGVRLDQAIFRGVTMELLLDDYGVAIEALRQRPEIDPSRIALLGSSEGTRLAPQLTQRSPEGIRGIAMIGYAADNAEAIVRWQLSAGPWRGIEHAIPAARDGRLTREEYDEAIAADPSLAGRVAFEPFDGDADDVITPEEVAEAMRPLLDAIVDAYEKREDALLWARLRNVTSAYLADWWEAQPNHVTLMELDVPLAIFHGALDNTTRVEGVHETAQALREAGRTNLEVTIVPDGDHDLNLDWRSARDQGPSGYRAAFDAIAGWLTTTDDAAPR